MKRVLSIGATGTMGRVVVPTIAAHGLEPVAFVRDASKANLPGVTLAVGDVGDLESVAAAIVGVDAIIMTHGGADGLEEQVDYGAVAAVLAAVKSAGGARPRIALMTSMSVSRPAPGPWEDAMNWKRRGERLLRASGAPYTILRPGWFDLQGAAHDAVVLEQGDATPVDVRRGVSRQHIADALVGSLLCDEALGTTSEIFAAPGEAPDAWEALFGALAKDAKGSLDGAGDVAGPALADEPARLQRDLRALGA